MSLTALELVHEFADKKGLPLPTALNATTVKDGRQFRALLHAVLRAAYDFNPEPARTQGSFAASGTVFQGNLFTLLPGFLRLVEGTLWNETRQALIAGPVSDATWAAMSATDVSGPEFSCWVDGAGNLYVRPAPISGETLKCIYLSKNLVYDSSTATLKEYITKDNDTFRLSDATMLAGLEYVWNLEKGEPYQEAYVSFVMALQGEKAQVPRRLQLDAPGHEARPGIYIPPGNWTP